MEVELHSSGKAEENPRSKESKKEETSSQNGKKSDPNALLINATKDVRNGVPHRRKRVQFKDIEILEPIGQGPMGKVFKANWKKYGMIVALRELKAKPSQLTSNGLTQSTNVQSFDNHIRLLRKISLHPNVLRIFGHVEDKKNDISYLVTEFMPLGDFQRLIEKSQISPETLQEKQKIKMLIEIATGLCHIHNCRVLHQNLVPHNILVAQNFAMKIADFGFAASEITNTNQKHAAPEWEEKHIYTKKSDVYSFGLIALELFSRSSDRKKEPVYVKLVPKEPFPFVPASIRPVFQSCLSKEPSERPTFARIVDLLEDFYYSSWKPEEEEKLPMIVESLHLRIKEKDEELKKRDDKIQQLMERIKRLEDNNQMNMNIQSSQAVNNMETLRHVKVEIPSPSAVQENIAASFHGTLKIPWQDFRVALEAHLNADADSVEKLKYLLVDAEGLADKSLWEHLLTWFSPMYPNGTSIEVTPQNVDTPFYVFQDIVDICGQSWFFGWMSPVDTNKLLLNKPTGTFLFRFSSYPGWYTLSVSNEGQVGHWRIRSAKGANWQGFFIDERKYASLGHIIETHFVEPLKVNQAKSTQRPIKLENPAERRENRNETLYSNF